MITAKDKEIILEAFKGVDVKKLELVHPDDEYVKWFRFGNLVGIDIATEIIKNLSEKEPTTKKTKIS